MNLGYRNFLLRLAALIHEPSRMHGKEPANVKVARYIAKHELHGFPVRKLCSEGFSLSHVALSLFQAALCEPQPPHAMGEPRRPEPDLRDLESVTLLEQPMLDGYFEATEFQLAHAAVFLRP